jgi:predicted O-linked N-acetylglucosamine transferase (SPINDLY family)
MESVAPSIDLGLEHHQAGRLTEAEKAYRQVLQADPHNSDAFHLLGVIASQLGKHENAVDLIDKALKIKPTFAEALVNRGNALQELKRYEDALDSFDRAITIKPQFPVAWSNRGNALKELGRYEEALASFDKALATTPKYPEALFNRGVVLYSLKRYEEALDSYVRLLEIKSDHVEALNNSGLALEALDRYDDALGSYQTAIAIKSGYLGALYNRANLLQKLKRHSEALDSFNKVLVLKPQYPEVLVGRGITLESLNRDDEALISYEAALAIRPDYAEALKFRGNVLRRLDQSEEALESYDRAISLKADDPEALYSRGLALYDLGRHEAAVESYRSAIKANPAFVEARSNLLFTFNHLSDVSLETLLEEVRAYGTLVARQAYPFTSWHTHPDPNRCLRIGWLSADFRSHSVGHFFQGVILALSRTADKQLRHFAYSNSPDTDAVTERIKACCHRWYSAYGVSDEQLAKQIHEDRVDILIDLSGHTAGNRLSMFAWKPAPVQVSWLGYAGTTGVAAIDYLIADSWTLPAAQEIWFTEKIWRLPESYLYFSPPNEDVQVSELPAISNGYITFGCYNNLPKITGSVLKVWAQLLSTIPDSRLLLKARQLAKEKVRFSILKCLAEHGVREERVILEGHVRGYAEHLASYGRMDIALDPFPYPGITTSLEALWMGVPVLTHRGESFVSRQGVGLLMNSGLPDWIATDVDDYVARAALHSADIQRLSTLRNSLRQQVLSSPIFDAPRFADHFETALRGMWSKWCHDQL